MACLCVFAGAAAGNTKTYKDDSFMLGQNLTKAGHKFIYGGGNEGLMGAFANGVIDQKGHITGVIPKFLKDREVAHTGLAQLITTDTMHERKMAMYNAADGFLILPGGLGTLDETMEVLTWRQLGRLSGPVFAFSPNGFWSPMRDMIDHIAAQGFIHSGGIGTVYWHESPEEIVKSCKAAFSA